MKQKTLELKAKKLFLELLHGSSKSTHDGELFDYTNKFIQVIKKYGNDPGFGGIIWTIGTTGGGKTAFMFILQNIFLDSSAERNVAFYRAPDSLLKAIKKHAPKKKYQRYRIIDKLREVQNRDLMSLDEGYMDADAKEALKKDKRNFTKSITALRHHGVFSLLNALDDGILKGYRKKANIKFYKQIPIDFIEESGSKFMKDYQKTLLTLKPQETLFTSNHPFFSKHEIFRGYLYTDLKDYCPWYHDDISRSMENQSFDFDYQKEMNLFDKIEPLVQLALDECNKSEISKKSNSTYLAGWLMRNHKELWFDHKENLPLIGKQLYYILKERNNENKKEGNMQEIKIKIPNTKEIGDFFRVYYQENDQNELIPNIAYYWIQGFSQRDIAAETGIGLTKVNAIVHDYREGIELNNDLLRFAYCYEFWICHLIGAERGGKIGEPDLWIRSKKDEIIGPGECKLYDNVEKSLTFYLELPKKDNKHTLTPSYRYCKEHDIPFFPLFCNNRQWKSKNLPVIDMCIPIDVYGDNKITISKSDRKNFIFNQFNPEQFFKNN